MLRRPLAHLEQQLGVGFLRSGEPLSGCRPQRRGVRAAQRVVACGRALQVVSQLGDPVTQILLAYHELRGGIGGRSHPAPRQELEHLARAHPLARLERGAGTTAGALGQGQLRIDVPLVGEECGPPLRQRQRPARTLDVGERGPQLTCGRVGRSLGATRQRQSRVQSPGDLRRDAIPQARERGAIQRLGGGGESRRGMERRQLAYRRSGGDRIPQTLQVGGSPPELLARGGGIAPLARHVAERESRQRRRALVAGGELSAERGLEQLARSGLVIAEQEQQTAALLRLGFAARVSSLVIQVRRPDVQPLRLGEGVELHGEIGAGERDARPGAGRRLERVGEPLGAPQPVERTLQLARGRERRGKLPPDGERARQRAGAVVDRQRVEQRRTRGPIVAAAQLQLAQSVERVRRIGPALVRPPGRQGVAVQRVRPGEVALLARQPGQVDEVGGGDLVPPVAPVQGQGGLELASRLVRITDALRQQAKVVAVRGDATGVADPLAQRERPHVPRPRAGQVSPIRTHPGQGPHRVRLDANVPHAGRQGAGALQIGLSAVEPTLVQEARTDIPERRGRARRIGDRERARQGATPDRDRGQGAIPAVRRDARAPHAVDPELRGPTIRRPAGEPGHLADQERVAPRHGIRRGQLAGCSEVVAGERAGYCLAHRERPRARLQHERRFGEARGEDA